MHLVLPAWVGGALWPGWFAAVQPYVGNNVNYDLVITDHKGGAKRDKDVLTTYLALCANVPTAPACTTTP